MHRKRFTRSLVPVVLSVLSLASSAQERGGDVHAQPQAQSQTQGPLVLNLSELVLDQYPVQHVDSEELCRLAAQLVGRNYFIKENGGTSSNGLNSMRLLGETIVLYDTKEQVQRARELLARLDVGPKEAESNRKSLEFRPRFVSLSTAADAIHPMVDSSRLLEERGLLVMDGSATDVDAALALLKRVDVPEKQVFLTCQMLEVVDAPQGPALPKDLADNLQKLLPQSVFAQTGMAMLKTSVGSRAQIEVRIDSLDRSYRLAFTPVAFDEASGSLTVSECTLTEEGNPSRQLFRTNTVLRGGEYTVLGATGAVPRLLVVRVVPQG